MAVSIEAIKNDPDFRALTPKQQARVLLIAEQAQSQRTLLGGPDARLEAMAPESFLSLAGRTVKEALMGPPERAQAAEAGIGLQPTAADLGKTALAGGGAMLGGAMFGQAAAAPAAMGMGAVGAWLGERVGHEAGAFGERLGLPKGTASTLGGAGALIGSIAGPIKGPQALGTLLRAYPHSRLGTLGRMLLGEGQAAAAGSAAAADPLIAMAETLAKQKTFANAPEALAWLRALNPQQQAAIAQQLSGAPASLPAAVAAPVAAAPAAAEAPVAQWLGSAPSTSAGNLRLVVPAARAAAPVAEATPVAAAPMAAPVAAEADPLLMQLRASLEAAKKPPLSRVPVAPPPPLQQTGDALFAKIVELRKTQGLSPAQIAKVVEEMSYQPGFKHLRPSEAKKMVEMVLQGID